jgi:hypothetical protein
VGDEVEVKVTDIDQDGRRIVLSRRQLESAREQENFQQFTRERQERQQQQTPGREPQRFTIGDALADQLGALGRGEDVAVPEPAAEPVDLTESVETLSASPVEDTSDFTATDPVPAPNSEGAAASGPVPAEDLSDFTAPEKAPADEAPSAHEEASPHEGESASTIVSEAAADAALQEEFVPDQSVSPQGMGGGGATGDTSEGRGEIVAVTEPTGEPSADEPTTTGAGGSALLEDEQAHTEASEEDARNA